MASWPRPKIYKIEPKQPPQLAEELMFEDEEEEDERCSEQFMSAHKVDMASYGNHPFGSKVNEAMQLLSARNHQAENSRPEIDEENDHRGLKKIDTLHGKSSTADTVSNNMGPFKITKLFKVGSDYLKGYVKNAAGDTFEGEIIGGKATGPGVLHLSSGITFKGNFEDDVKNGPAEEILPSGIKVLSTYVNGRRQGHFETLFPDGSIFKGYFENGEEHALGEFTDRNGTILRGHFKKGKLEGTGIANYANGNKYDGDFISNKRHGFGIYFWTDGRSYHGEWQNDVQHGNGVIFDPHSGVKRKGTWKDGHLIQFTGKVFS